MKLELHSSISSIHHQQQQHQRMRQCNTLSVQEIIARLLSFSVCSCVVAIGTSSTISTTTSSTTTNTNTTTTTVSSSLLELEKYKDELLSPKINNYNTTNHYIQYKQQRQQQQRQQQKSQHHPETELFPSLLVVSSETRSIGTSTSDFVVSKKNSLLLQHCHGDCDIDSDCVEGLVCFHRFGQNESVPGCSSSSTIRRNNSDVCVHPADVVYNKSSSQISSTTGSSSIDNVASTNTVDATRKRSVNILRSLYSNGSNATITSTAADTVVDSSNNSNVVPVANTDTVQTEKKNIQRCHADCFTDIDCAIGLRCMIRPSNTNPPVPGCSGLRLYTAGRNFCYDPQYLNTTTTSTTTTTIPMMDEYICLYQEDFVHGTIQIRYPGKYKLCENITFCPNAPPPPPPPPATNNNNNSTSTNAIIPDDAFDPILPSDKYEGHAFALGFFSAIAISANDTILDLNGYTFEQCREHALMQRFFSIIELAAQPFIKGAGPHSFVGPNGTFHCGNNIVITGPGRLGLSSHHAIHGNENINITIKNIEFENFEVAAISMNNVDGLLIENNDVLGNRKDIPVVGVFSAARFIRPYLKYLIRHNYSMMIRNQLVTASDLYDRLIVSINNVYNDVMATGEINNITHPVEYELFYNPLRIIDGPCYAFLVHGKGPAVNGFGYLFPNTTNLTSSNVTIRGNRIKDFKCFNNEIPAAVENKTVVMDVRGSVFQFYNTLLNKSISINGTDGTYIGNIVADSQIMVAKAILDGIYNTTQDDPTLMTNLNTIPKEIVTWAEAIPVNGVTPSYKPAYRCNGDSMHHVAKGIVMIRVEQTMGFSIENNTIDEVENYSGPGFQNCTDFHVLADPENANQCQIANLRAISIAATRPFQDDKPSRVVNNVITNFFSKNGPFIIGIDVQGDTKGLHIFENFINLNAHAKNSTNDSYYALIIGENADDSGLNSTIVIDQNYFAHEQLIQNVKTNRHRTLLRQTSSKDKSIHRIVESQWLIHPHGRALGEIDPRNFGGCPMGF